MKLTKKTFGEEVVAVPTEVALERAQTLGSRIRAVRKHKNIKQKDAFHVLGESGH